MEGYWQQYFREAAQPGGVDFNFAVAVYPNHWFCEFVIHNGKNFEIHEVAWPAEGLVTLIHGRYVIIC
jgi:hypothetical protein